jgi:L-amino acid N-acyltransferase YncA
MAASVPHKLREQAMIICAAKPHDINAIVEIWAEGQTPAALESARDLGFSPREYFGRLIASPEPGFGTFVAKRDSIILGWCSATPCRAHPIFRQQMAEVSVYVRKDSRHYGIGGTLLESVPKLFVNITTFVAFIGESNCAAIRNSEKVGWTRIGAMPNPTPGAIQQVLIYFLGRSACTP